MDRNVDGTVTSGLKWYEGPEWEGWGVAHNPLGNVFRRIAIDKGEVLVRWDGALVVRHITEVDAIVYCASTEHARQIGEAWVKGWS